MYYKYLMISLGLLASSETHAEMRTEFEAIACNKLYSAAEQYFNELISICSSAHCRYDRPFPDTTQCNIIDWNDDSFKIRFEYERTAKPLSWLRSTIKEKATSACYFNSSYEWQCLFESTEFGIYNYSYKTRTRTLDAYPEQYQPRFNSAILEATKEYDL